jgi:hypothetical protein
MPPRFHSAGLAARLAIVPPGQLVQAVEEFAQCVTGGDGLPIRLGILALPGPELTRSFRY